MKAPNPAGSYIFHQRINNRKDGFNMRTINLSCEERNTLASFKDRIYVQEVLQAMSDLKPVARFGFDERSEKEMAIPRVLSGLGLEVLICKEPNANPSQKIIYTGHSLAKLRAAHSARLNHDHYALGNLLGYPGCCVRQLVSDPRNFDRHTTLPYSYNNNFEILDYRVNNIYNAQSYSDNSILTEKYYRHIGGLNNLHRCFFISHIPCSYGCEESLKIAKNTEKVLDRNFPSISEHIRYHLRKGVIILGMLEFVIFSYSVNEDKINYNVLLNSPLVDSGKLNLIKNGDHAMIKDENSVEIFSGEVDLGEFQCKLILFK